MVCLFSCLLSVWSGINSDGDHMPRALKLWWKGSIGQEDLHEWPWMNPHWTRLWFSTGGGSLSFTENRGGERQHVQQGAGLDGGNNSLLLRKDSRTGTSKSSERVVRRAGSPLAASAASWIVCCWKGGHQNSGSLWNLLHRISFTLSKMGSSW